MVLITKNSEIKMKTQRRKKMKTLLNTFGKLFPANLRITRMALDLKY